MRIFLFAMVMSLSMLPFRGAAEDLPQGDALTLKKALSIALQNSPRLLAWEHQVAADRAMLLGDEAYPNPELAVDVEDFLGSGYAHGVDALQVTASLSQEVQLGGKPGARRNVKTARKEISVLEYEIEKHFLMNRVTTAYLEVLAYERRLENAREVELLATETMTVFKHQVDAGRATPLEVDKATIVLSLASLSKDRAQHALQVSKRTLASVCGEEEVFFENLDGSLETIRPMIALDELLKRIEENPTMLVKSANMQHQQAVLELERTSRVPDVSFSLGYRWVNATNDSARVAGISVPLPLVNRNQGPIEAAAKLSEKSKKEAEHQRLELVRELVETYHLLAVEQKRATVLKDVIYPKVEATFQAVKDGYQIGRFGYLDLLDAQRTLFEVKQQTLDAMITYQQTTVHLALVAVLPISTEMFAETETIEKGAEAHDQ